jgi:hypothetical protein
LHVSLPSALPLDESGVAASCHDIDVGTDTWTSPGAKPPSSPAPNTVQSLAAAAVEVGKCAMGKQTKAAAANVGGYTRVKQSEAAAAGGGYIERPTTDTHSQVPVPASIPAYLNPIS